MTSIIHSTYDSVDGLTRIHAMTWVPDGEIKAILQISHGMQEFIARYSDFAHFLTSKGFLVTGNDHLGHGESISPDGKLGYFADRAGNKCVLADIHRLRLKTAHDHPGIPYFMLGHSMGSFLMRQYIGLYGEGLSGAIIMGTGGQPTLVLFAGMAVCGAQSLFTGWKAKSPLVTLMAFGSYNKKIKKRRTNHDWLTKDTAIVDAYRSNPLNMFPFTLNGYFNMFRSIFRAQSKRTINHIPKDLPVLFASGADDPVGSYGKEVIKASEAFKKAGIGDVSLQLYEGDRHEILNETDRAVVYEDLYEWMMERV